MTNYDYLFYFNNYSNMEQKELIIMGRNVGKQSIQKCKSIFEELREKDPNFNYVESCTIYRIDYKKDKLYDDLIKDIQL